MSSFIGEQESQLAQNQIASETHSQINNASQVDQGLIKVNGDMEEPCKIWVCRIVVGVFVVAVFAMFFVGSYESMKVPQTFIKIGREKVSLNNGEQQCNPTSIDNATQQVSCLVYSSSNPRLGLYTSKLSVLNQFVIYYLNIQLPYSISQNLTINQNTQLKLYEIQQTVNNNNEQQLYARKLLYDNSYLLQIQGINRKDYQVFENQERMAKLETVIAYDRILDEDFENGNNQSKTSGEDQEDDEKEFVRYLAVIQFGDYNQLTQLQKVTLKSMTVNPKYTIFTIILRSTYFLLSLISSIIFIRRYRQLDPQDRILQLKLVVALSVLLLFFNDPFYSITILHMNPVSTFFSCFVVINMLMFLLVFWVFFIRRIFLEPESKESELPAFRRSWGLYAVMLALLVAVSILFNQYSFYILQKIPIITMQDLKKMNIALTILIVAILTTCILLYIILAFFRILCKNCHQPPKYKRHQNFMFFLPFFMLIYIGFFSSGASMPFSLEGIWVLYGYSFTNGYVILLQYLYYTPAQQLKKRCSIIKNSVLIAATQSDINQQTIVEKQEIVVEQQTELQQEIQSNK